LTITHGILTGFNGLIREMDDVAEFDAHRESKKINWNETKVFDNSNRANVAIYKERWR